MNITGCILTTLSIASVAVAAPTNAPPTLIKPEPARWSEGQVLVGPSSLVTNVQGRLIQVFLQIDRNATANKPIANGLGKAGDLLRQWAATNTAAGHHGDVYDNHDGDHSNMSYGAFPQLTRVEFDESLKKIGMNNGLQHRLLYNAVTLGNSSTALVNGPFWRSQGRNALTLSAAGGHLYLQYRNNHLYFYPEHRDYDPGRNGADGKGYGDVLPANHPYIILSQGSSGSDRIFMDAVAATLAAFQPEVKRRLVEKGLLMPTLQMIFRTCNQLVQKPEQYLTGTAHPPVFDGKQIDVEKMVQLAHAITPEALPPLAQLVVAEENLGIVGRDYFDVADRERLLDTPCAVARVVKSFTYTRRMVLDARTSLDPQDKPLAYHWVILRGDPERIRIRPLDATRRRVELEVDHHPRRPIAPGSDMESNRIDIGLFVHNGHHYSPPAFVSLLYLDNEKREYDAQHRIRAVDYTHPETRDNYVDPAIDARKDWRDEFHYDDKGKLLDWTRRRGEQRQEFTAEGRLITRRGSDSAPQETRKVTYRIQAKPNTAPVLEQQTVEE